MPDVSLLFVPPTLIVMNEWTLLPTQTTVPDPGAVNPWSALLVPEFVARTVPPAVDSRTCHE